MQERYIKASDAVNALCKNAGDDATIAGFMALVDGIPSADAAPAAWISVEDKLPADGMNILVANIKTGNQYVSHKDLVYFDTDHNACAPTSYFQTFVFTHWMPLPEPPKEEA